MKMFFQLAFVCSVGLFGCGSQVSHAGRVPADAIRISPPAAARVTTATTVPVLVVVRIERPS